MIKFGPAGIPQKFYDLGNKHSVQMGKYLHDMGLNAFEYQCGNGVTIGLPKAAEVGKKCAENGITVSLHAPYYISLSSIDEEKRLNSLKYITKSAETVKAMGGNRIVVHCGTNAGRTREEATELSVNTLLQAYNELKNLGLDSVHICPETMGKINQIGTLEEVLYICKQHQNFIPVIDFGHLNARSMGGIKTQKDYEEILDNIENELGHDILKIFHIHFSKIEYTKGGEKKHLTFEDTVFGPNFEPLAELLYKKQLEPTIICESDETMDIDALKMKHIFESFGGK